MPKQLRVGGVPEHFNLPWRMAVADGAFERAGVRVAWKEVPEGTGELTRALRDNDLDVALVLTEGAVADIVKNDKNRLVKVYVSSPLIWGIHVAADSHLKRVSDLKGKRVAISRYGSGSHLIAIVDAASRGWPTDDMQFVVVNSLDGARDALANGRADVFLWERHMTQPLVDSGDFRRVSQRDVPWPAFVVSVRRGILDSRADELRTVLDTVARVASNLKRRQSAPQLIADTFRIRLKDATAWFETVRWSSGYRCPTAALRRVVTALHSQGVIDQPRIDPTSIWHSL